MNHIKQSLFAVFSLVCISNSYAEPAYQIDPKHSYVEWKISHFGFSDFSGKWFVSGMVDYSDAKKEQSKTEVSINMADVVTGLDDLNKHLKGKQFFNVNEFPKATFVSKQFIPQSGGRGEVHGILTIKDVSQPIVLKVKLNKIGVNPITERPTIGFSGESQLKRSDFGIDTLLPALGDEITLNIQIEAYKENQE